jgi:hypothetical protein
MTQTANLNEERLLLTSAYQEFDARNIEAALERLHPEVEWANGMEGGHVHGRDGVRRILDAPVGDSGPAC